MNESMCFCFTVGEVILDSPVHPVTEGQTVILYCKPATDILLSNVDFYRNEELLETNGQMVIPAVSKSDEGFYKCKYSGEESPRSWMSVGCEHICTMLERVGVLVVFLNRIN